MNSGTVLAFETGWWKDDAPARSSRTKPTKAKYPIGTKMLSTRQAAEELGVSVWTVYDYIKTGLLETVPKLKGYQVPEPAIHKFREYVKLKRRI